MRTIKRVVAFICLAITALACEKPVPVIQVKEAVPQLGYMQTIASIRYDVENADGNRISASASHPWIHSFSIGDEVVSFTVDENNTGGPRTADIKLEYPGAEPVIVPVLQSWAASGITITPASATAAYTGGQGSFSFEVGNPRAGVDITISSESDWITNISKTENSVSYTVLENNSGKARSGKIVLKYGSFATAEFTITQAWTASMIVLTPASAELDYIGGTGSFSFTIENPRAETEVTVSCDCPWITNVTQEGDTVSYSVSENESGKHRTGELLLTYDVLTCSSYSVVQKGAPITSLSLNKESATILVGNSEKLIAITSPVDAELKWTSSNENVATVDSDGIVTAISKGAAVIIVQSVYGQKMSSINIMVEMPKGSTEDIGTITWK